ncbi:MAG: LytTR family DNA-binding domain-containing protein [Blautia sp.]|nr:LytTR family DNA-binding domain-containing protein [Blautia sp.]MCM1200423.1 LytTR family DNA-binding domain-containing protein [Bacteroides fragilis]
MKALLVDDDVQYCEFFLGCLLEICDGLEIEMVCDTCYDAGRVLKHYPGYDVYFLDIEMEGINGIELADEIRRRNVYSGIFFVSFHESYVFDAFGVKADGFIRKKELRGDLHKALSSVMKREMKEQSIVKIQMDSGGYLRIKPAELLYCQSEEHYVRFQWQDEGSELHRIKLSEVEKELKECHFLRVHERYLVNRAYIRALQPNKLILLNGQEIPISRSYKKRIQTILFDL